MNDINITGYKIKVSEIKESGETVDYVLATVPSPVYPQPVKVRKSFAYDSSLKFVIESNNIYIDNNHRISVFIDNKKLSDIFVMFNEERKEVTLEYSKIEPWQRIEIEYHYDGIEYIHETNNYCLYNIEPVIDYSRNTIGNHNILV